MQFRFNDKKKFQQYMTRITYQVFWADLSWLGRSHSALSQIKTKSLKCLVIIFFYKISSLCTGNSLHLKIKIRPLCDRAVYTQINIKLIKAAHQSTNIFWYISLESIKICWKYIDWSLTFIKVLGTRTVFLPDEKHVFFFVLISILYLLCVILVKCYMKYRKTFKKSSSTLNMLMFVCL